MQLSLHGRRQLPVHFMMAVTAPAFGEHQPLHDLLTGLHLRVLGQQDGSAGDVLQSQPDIGAVRRQQQQRLQDGQQLEGGWSAAHLVKEHRENLQVIAHVNATIDPQQLLLIFSHRVFKSLTLNDQVFILLLP